MKNEKRKTNRTLSFGRLSTILARGPHAPAFRHTSVSSFVLGRFAPVSARSDEAFFFRSSVSFSPLPSSPRLRANAPFCPRVSPLNSGSVPSSRASLRLLAVLLSPRRGEPLTALLLSLLAGPVVSSSMRGTKRGGRRGR